MTSPLEARRLCRWCRQPIPDDKRSDATACSKSCRQAAHRFSVGVAPAGGGGVAASSSMRFAYADPPYPGLARRYYGPDAAEVDHPALIARLVAEFPDGWALSTSARALQSVLVSCPPGARVCPWVRGARATRSRAALNAWEPLIVVGGRRRTRTRRGGTLRRLGVGRAAALAPGGVGRHEAGSLCRVDVSPTRRRAGRRAGGSLPGVGSCRASLGAVYVSRRARGDTSR